jgi:alpha-glucoside transport system permease protein
VHIAVLFFVCSGRIPTLGILVTSLRDKNQIIASGWWNSFFSSTQTGPAASGADKAVQKDGKFVIEGKHVRGSPARSDHRLRHQEPRMRRPNFRRARWPISARATLQINADGSYRAHRPPSPSGTRGQRVYYRRTTPPRFTTENYRERALLRRASAAPSSTR